MKKVDFVRYFTLPWLISYAEYPAFTFYNSLVEWIQDHPPPSLPVKLTIESDPIESILAPLAIKEAGE